MSADDGGIMRGMIEIRQLQYSELTALPGYAEMFAAHVAACHVPEFGVPEENREAWAALEAAGAVRAFAAFDGECLAGFLFGVLSPNLHYSACRMFCVDTIYVHPSARRQGVGGRLLEAARQEARREGCIAVKLGVPPESAAEWLADRAGRCLELSYVIEA